MSKDKYAVLKEHFGFTSFRDLQAEAIDAILAKRDLLMILPTGGGKSLTYQLPTLLMDGVTIVISPLLALMHDQVMSLQANNLQAAMLSSMQTKEESDAIYASLLRNELQYLYLSPERLNNPFMIDFLQKIAINYFVIDEAHCISEWGQEFRSDFRLLSNIKTHFNNIAIAAFTATATTAVKSDIITQLRLENPEVFVGEIYRENLHVSITPRITNGYRQLETFLQQHKGSGIVYALSRKNVETIASHLIAKGYSAKAYHAGISTSERSEVYSDFVYDKIDIIVATIAFGMGIDKSDIRFVVHMSMPKTIENYYQEMGRAGRDGEESSTLLLYGASDIISQKRFIDESPNEEYKEILLDKLDAMAKLCSTELCRHQYIARYFDSAISTCKSHCDNCLSDFKTVDITKESQMLLSTIYRTQQMFGKNYIIDILRGSKDKKILQNGHDKLSVYSIGTMHSKKIWYSILERLMELNLITLNAHKGLMLTPEARLVLRGDRAVNIRQERIVIKEKKIAVSHQESVAYDESLFEKLRELRAHIAQEESIPAYIVFNDKTLKAMSASIPQSKEEFLEVNGVGEVKYQRYGEAFLELLRTH